MSKQNGYTLLETILVIAIILIMTVSIFAFYNKLRTDEMVSLLSQDMIIIDNGVEAAYQSLGSGGALSTVSNTFAISSNIIPTQLAYSSSGISNTFGGDIVLAPAMVSTISGMTNGYSMTLSGVPSSACAKIATSNFSSYVQDVLINGTQVKTNGALYTGSDTANIASLCLGNSNTIVFENALKTPIPGACTAGSPCLAVRGKALPQYVATISNSPAVAPSSCSGGTSNNGSFCACPSGTSWNGSACVAFGSTSPQPGTCPFGQGWLPDTKTCAALPHGASSGYYAAWSGGSGKYLPTVTNANPAFQTSSGGTSLPSSYSEVIAGRTITSTAGYNDNLNVEVCVNGTWNATAQRCETPIPTCPTGQVWNSASRICN